MSEWLHACSFDEMTPATARRLDLVGTDGVSYRVALVRIGDDFYAVGDRCSHADVSLSEGTVYDDECQLECIKHGSLFSLTTGAALTFPATRPVPVFDVKREGDAIMVCVPGQIVGPDGLKRSSGDAPSATSSAAQDSPQDALPQASSELVGSEQVGSQQVVSQQGSVGPVR